MGPAGRPASFWLQALNLAEEGHGGPWGAARAPLPLKCLVRETGLGPSSGGVLRGQGEEQPCMLKIRVTVLSQASPYLLPTPAQALGHGRFICCAARAAPHGPPWPSSARFNIYRYGGTEKFHCGAQTLLLLSIIHVRNTLFLQFSP